METTTDMTNTVAAEIRDFMDDIPGLFSLVATLAIMILLAG